MELAKETFYEDKSMPLTLSKKEKNLYRAFIGFSFISLFIGGLMGLLQVLERSGNFNLPAWLDYYQILTVHGVMLGLVMTTFFIIGFQFSLMGKSVGMSDTQRKLGWLSFWVMLAGTLMSATMILLGRASVLYTFYAPLQAHPVFYMGLALVVVGSWIAVFVNFRQLYA